MVAAPRSRRRRLRPAWRGCPREPTLYLASDSWTRRSRARCVSSVNRFKSCGPGARALPRKGLAWAVEAPRLPPSSEAWHGLTRPSADLEGGVGHLELRDVGLLGSLDAAMCVLLLLGPLIQFELVRTGLLLGLLVNGFLPSLWATMDASELQRPALATQLMPFANTNGEHTYLALRHVARLDARELCLVVRKLAFFFFVLGQNPLAGAVVLLALVSVGQTLKTRAMRPGAWLR